MQRLKSTENGEALVRRRLARIAADLKEALEELPSDLRAQVAIGSAIAFVELVLDNHLGDEKATDPPSRPMGIAPPAETT